MLTWKIVGASKVSILYIYIEINYTDNFYYVQVQLMTSINYV